MLSGDVNDLKVKEVDAELEGDVNRMKIQSVAFRLIASEIHHHRNSEGVGHVGNSSDRNSACARSSNLR